MSTLPLGPFARDLTNARDIALALISVLANYNEVASARCAIKAARLAPSHRAQWERLIQTVIKRLSMISPPFTYVGHHPTDPSLWGVWIDFGLVHHAEQNGILTQGDTNAKGRSTYILDLSGRGVRLLKRRGLQLLWEDV